VPKDIRTRLALPAAFAAFIIPVIFAIFEVQEWKVPVPLAVALLVILFVMLIIALGMVFYEVVKAGLQILEHRATSASWVSTEAPGLLDYEADGLRANKRFTSELDRLTKDVERLGKRLKSHTAFMETINKSGRKVSPQLKQKRGNQAAKDIDRSAIYTEKRIALFRALVGDIARNFQGLVTAIEFETDEDRAAGQNLVQILARSQEATQGALVGVTSYRDSVKGVEQKNLSRTIRIASKRLAGGIEELQRIFRQHGTNSERLRRSLEAKLKS
jgi:hypothetical protein